MRQKAIEITTNILALTNRDMIAAQKISRGADMIMEFAESAVKAALLKASSKAYDIGYSEGVNHMAATLGEVAGLEK